MTHIHYTRPSLTTAQELTHTQHTAAHTSAVNDIDLQHDRLVAATAGEDGQVHVISLADLKTRSTLCEYSHRTSYR